MDSTRFDVESPFERMSRGVMTRLEQMCISGFTSKERDAPAAGEQTHANATKQTNNQTAPQLLQPICNTNSVQRSRTADAQHTP